MKLMVLAVEFLNMFSYVAIGYVWLKMLIYIQKINDKKSDFLSIKNCYRKILF